MRWSPHAISADLRAEGYQICAETIYVACYDPTSSRGLPSAVGNCWPRRYRKRKPRSRITAKPNALGDYKPITHRPIAVEQRVEAGHWEGDLIIGANNTSAVVTLVERVSRHSVLAALPQVSPRNTPPQQSSRRCRVNPNIYSTLLPGTKDAKWHTGLTSNKPSTSTSTSANRVHHGNAPATNKPTHYSDAGYPKAQTSTSTQHNSLSSKTTSTTCPANSTTGNQPTTSTLHSLASTTRVCAPKALGFRAVRLRGLRLRQRLGSSRQDSLDNPRRPIGS